MSSDNSCTSTATSAINAVAMPHCVARFGEYKALAYEQYTLPAYVIAAAACLGSSVLGAKVSKAKLSLDSPKGKTPNPDIYHTQWTGNIFEVISAKIMKVIGRLKK